MASLKSSRSSKASFHSHLIRPLTASLVERLAQTVQSPAHRRKFTNAIGRIADNRPILPGYTSSAGLHVADDVKRSACEITDGSGFRSEPPPPKSTRPWTERLPSGLTCARARFTVASTALSAVVTLCSLARISSEGTDVRNRSIV
jgi:hypothetical protein